MTKLYSGVNIQWPISQQILSGEKTIETRHYPLPVKYENQELLLIETPGPHGDFLARIAGTIVFSESVPYMNESEFYRDGKRHLVDRGSPWKWVPGKKKWGWKIAKVKIFEKPVPAPRRKGIRFTTGISLNKTTRQAPRTPEPLCR